MPTHNPRDRPYYPPPYEERPPSYHQGPAPTGHSHSSTGIPGEERISNAQLYEERFVESTLRWMPPPPSYSLPRGARLQKIVLIPRVTPNNPLKPPLPFFRAYSPVLRDYNIRITDFMEFIDNLSIAQAGSPVFSAVNAAGMAVGFVPSHWTAIAGTGMQVAAGVGSAAVSKIRTKKFLDETNEAYFGPRGLRASIKKDGEVAAMVGFPRSLPPLAPVDGNFACITLRDRRMAALQPYISPLITDVPPPSKQPGMLDKIAAKQLEKTTQKTESKELRKHQRIQEKQDKRERRAEEKEQRRDRRNRRDRRYEDPGPYQHGQQYDDHVAHRRRSTDSDASLEAIVQEMRRLNLEAERVYRHNRSSLDHSQPLANLELERNELNRRLNSRLNKARERGQRQQVKDMKKLERMDYIVIENASY